MCLLKCIYWYILVFWNFVNTTSIISQSVTTSQNVFVKVTLANTENMAKIVNICSIKVFWGKCDRYTIPLQSIFQSQRSKLCKQCKEQLICVSKSISWSGYVSSISYFIIVISSHVFGCWNNWESGPRCRNTGVEPICSVSYLGQPHHHHHFAIILIVVIFHITYIENCCLISHHMYRTIENRDPGAGGRAYWKLIALICCQTTSQQNQEGWFWSSTLWLTDWQIPFIKIHLNKMGPKGKKKKEKNR